MADRAYENALKRRAELQAELAEVEEFLRLWARFGDPQDDRSISSSPMDEGGDIRGQPESRSVQARIARKAREIILRLGRPMTRGELARAILDEGFPIPGTDPEGYIGTLIWRAKNSFINVEGQGYWPIDIPAPRLISRTRHRFKIVARANDQFGVQFVYNAEVIFWSESYKAKASAQNCIESLKKNAPDAPTADLTKGEKESGFHFEIDKAKNGETYVRFVASNGETMVHTETYSSKSGSQNAIESLKKNGPGAEIDDETA